MLCTIWEEISAKGGSAGRAKRSFGGCSQSPPHPQPFSPEDGGEGSRNRQRQIFGNSSLPGGVC
jgi:hypothetical protein